MDDEYVAFNNEQINKGVKAIPEIFRTSYALGKKASYEYRPLVKVTFAIEHQLFGGNPHISHFLNILFYFFAVSILFYILLLLIPEFHYVFALLVCILFLIHPLHSEVVMSLKNRDAIMSFTACMISLFFYIRYVTDKGWLNLIAGAICMLIALMSKTDSLTFFAVIPFTVWFLKKASLKKIGYVVLSLSAAPVLFNLAARSVQNEKNREIIEWENPLFFNTTLWNRIPQGFYSIYYYVKMFFIPTPLVSYYGYNQIPLVGWKDFIVWFVIALLGVIGYFIVKNFSSKPIWIYGLLYFFITISMFTNVVKPVVGIVGERFAFIPSLGLCLVVVYFLLTYLKVPFEKLTAKLSSFDNKLWMITTVVVLVFGIRTFARNAAWKDAYTLYKTDVINAPESAHTHSLLAATAIARVRTEAKLSKKEKRELILEAEEHYKEAIRIIPNYISCNNNLGMVYYSYLNDPENAVKYLSKAVALDTNYVEAYFNLGSSYAALKKFDESEKCYLKSIEINPDFYNTYTSLSALYAYQKRPDKIVALNQKAIDKGVISDALYVNIGNVYFMSGDTLKALPYLEKAVELNFNNYNLNFFLSDYYTRKQDPAKAEHYRILLSKSTRQ